MMKEMLLLLLMAISSIMLVDSAPFPEEDCIQGDTCLLPDCFCADRNNLNVPRTTPGNLPIEAIPQMVVFSFDDAVNVLNYEFYQALFPTYRKNPNGCPISMTLFVWHNYTDYNMVRSLYDRGMEIASHSVTHRTPTDFWRQISRTDMLYEAVESRRLISERSGIPLDHIYGWRFPFHQTGGDLSFEVLQEAGYEYDSSLYVPGTSGNTQQQWPLTLDFGFPEEFCVNRPCLQKVQKGFWEVPVVPIADREDIYPCTYIDGCFFQPTNRAEALELLLNNFEANYSGQRAPLYINMHAWWFSTDFKLQAMKDFIDILLEKDDVYIVNFHQMLAWVKDPTPLGALSTFEPWRCEQ